MIKDKIILLVVCVLALVLLATFSVLLIGLFDSRVDNKDIFSILGPAFQMIVGAFIGVIGGRTLDRRDDTNPKS